MFLKEQTMCIRSAVTDILEVNLFQYQSQLPNNLTADRPQNFGGKMADMHIMFSVITTWR
jgi:hypothetical protein